MPRAGTDACVFVMFGATGDLMRRKLLPALFQLSRDRLLPAGCQILGVARDPAQTDTGFRAQMRAALADAGLAADSAHWCDDCLHYQAVDPSRHGDYVALGKRIECIESARGLQGNRVLYLALPPAAFPGSIEALGRAGLNHSRGWTRLVIEKPFGHDFVSARHLNALVHACFSEEQVFRIDHYLGKETVQNLLAFRFGNALFESVWNRDHIRSVQITVAEELGVENRAAYYEMAGALRDIVQNHLTQLLTLIAMEVPVAFEAGSIRFEKIKVLRSIAPILSGQAVFGQYAAAAGNGSTMRGYRDEPGVAADSTVDTFVALRLEIENWRWQGVPFYLQTGKRLSRRVTQIRIEFRSPPIALFRAVDGCSPQPNVLTITLQPDEGVELSFGVKVPGERMLLKTQRMTFRYAAEFGAPSTGYETLLRDVVQGDQTLFVHAEEAELAWGLYAPLLERRDTPHPYPAGSWGPPAADALLRPADQAWAPNLPAPA